MKRFSVKALAAQSYKSTANIAFFAVLFVCGAVIGCIISANSDAVASGLITSGSSDFSAVIQNGVAAYSFKTVFFNLIKYPIIIFVCSFTVFGFAVIPAVVALKGFSVSYSATAIASAAGSNGIMAAISFLGVQTLITIPCLLLLASVGFETSRSVSSAALKTQTVSSVNRVGFFPLFGLFVAVVVLMLIFSVVDFSLTPIFISHFIS